MSDQVANEPVATVRPDVEAEAVESAPVVETLASKADEVPTTANGGESSDIKPDVKPDLSTPEIEGKTAEEAEDLMARVAKQSELICALRRLKSLTNIHSELLLLRRQSANRQILLHPHGLQLRGMGPHPDHPDFQTNAGI